MSPEATTWVVACAVGAFALAMVGAPTLQGVLHSRADSAHRFALPRLTTSVCAAPPQRFRVDQAHRAMQLHVDCLIGECPRKTHAYNVLVEEGHVRPDTGRIRA